MKIGLLGHGTVGIGVDRIIKEQPEMEVKKILSLVIDDEMAGRTAASFDDILSDAEIDTVVEVMGGVHPAFEYLEAAMNAGKNAVTSNKAVVAACYEALAKTAAKNHVSFRCTAAVGGSIPWLVNLARNRRADKLTSIFGIMNGTTNFILNAMTEKGMSFNDALSEAARLGYAERDPSADIDGPDVRRKLVISSNVAFDTVLPEDSVPTYGIRRITDEDIAFADRNGAVIKLTGRAIDNGDGTLTAFVVPAFVPKTAMEAHLSANYNFISYAGTYSGIQTYMGEGAGRFPTAYNVVEDLYDVLETRAPFYQKVFEKKPVNNGVQRYRFYIREEGNAELTAPMTFEEMTRKAGKDAFVALVP